MADIKEAGDRLYEGLGSKKKEEIILDIVMNTDQQKRLEICKYYRETYGKELYNEMKSKLGAPLKELAIHLFLPYYELVAKFLKKGFRGFSVDDSIVFETLTLHNQEELRHIEEAYKKEANKELSREIEKNYSGTLKKNLLNLLYTPRRVNKNPDKTTCDRYATTLIDVGESNWVGDENVFKDIFISCSGEELVLVSRFYLQKTGNNMLDTIEKKFSAKNKLLLRELFYNNIIPHELFAEKIYQSIKGLGTNTTVLNRVLVSRNGVDMDDIRDIYPWKANGNTLQADIMGDTSGNYQKLCLYLAEC